MDYLEKLKDPRWQRKRLRILERDGWRCKACYDDKNTLHVHHLFYFKGDPWDIPDGFLITLCEDCHENKCPYLEDYPSCKECHHYSKNKGGNCDGSAGVIGIDHIGLLLNTIWEAKFTIDELFEIARAISKSNRDGLGPAIDCEFTVKPFDFEAANKKARHGKRGDK